MPGLRLMPRAWPWVASAASGLFGWRKIDNLIEPTAASSSPEQDPLSPARPSLVGLVSIVAVTCVVTASGPILATRDDWLVDHGTMVGTWADQACAAASLACVIAALIQGLVLRGSKRQTDLRVFTYKLLLFTALAWIPLVLRQLLHSGLLVLQVAPGACLVFPARSLHAAAVGASSLAAVAASMAPRAPSTDEEQKIQRQELGALRAFAILHVLAPLLFIGLTVLAGSIAHQIVLFGILLASSTAAFVKVCAAHSRCRLIAVTDEAEDDDADDASRSRAARAVVALATFLPVVLGFATGAMLVALATATDGCPASFGTFGEVIASGQGFPAGFSGSAGQARLWDAVAMSTALNAFGAVSFICCATLVMLRTVHAVARDRRAIATATAESLQSALRVMSHETRGPTNAAVLALSLLDAALADERVHEARELLRDLRISLNRTKQGLDSLLALQSADAVSAANDVNWAWGPAHVDALITVRSAMRGACEAEGVGLELAFAEPGDCERKTPALLDASLAGWEVFVDADKVAAICTNFVSNALKHAPEVSPMVRVCASIVQTDEGWPVAEVQTLARAKSSMPTSGPRRCMLLLEVLDNGEGMSTEDLTSGKLFAPFARLRQGDGRLRMASTGLGLSIVKSLALGCGSGSSSPDATVPANEDDLPPSRSRHRRAVTVSHSRRSSTASEARSREARAFRRSQRNVQRQSRRGSFPSGHSVGDSQRALPGLDEEAAGSAADSLDPAPPHCIIVDDDSLTRQLTARLVRSWGFTVDELQDGTELVEHLRQLVSTAGRSSTSHPATPLVVGGTQLASERQRNSGLPIAESGAASALTLRGDSSGTLHIAVTSPKAQPGHRPGRSFDWESGSVATTVARPKLPVLVCLDSNMPKMDGPDALVELRRIFTAAGDGMTALFEGITVVGITGHSAAADHQVFLDAGAKAVLTKPVDPDRLLAIAAPLKA
ncbi:hypothetical protein FNF29_06513 [Cafeteria roenbergensis]|uniref:histidine kinase n=1 Tax=Cafeteria roenbergensis TaxID=33653 RepID=A0A5A8CA64_CAFRO|nr:hypothetical protein FNF29_06513 [Cafeteria roenbergensis]|eukprot:KAA0148731.1 hypothetical protein FNF29_06513 [Cafeteria roenbergensis]